MQFCIFDLTFFCVFDHWQQGPLLITMLRSLRRSAVRTLVGGSLVVAGLEVTTRLPSEGRSSRLYHRIADEVVTPLLRLLPPELAHHAALRLSWLSPTYRPSVAEQRVQWSQTLFENQQSKTIIEHPIGLAAGFDKNGTIIQPMLDLGFAFVEIGTVTPQPQPGNPQPRLFRLREDRALINRYGFNSEGMEQVAQHLAEFRKEQQTQHQKHFSATSLYHWLYPNTASKGLVGVNLGKNKSTSQEDAANDYSRGILTLGPLADYLVVNISSPNTPNLRDLQQTESLKPLLLACLQARNQLETPVPLLVKVAPDLSDAQLEEIARLCLELQIDGLIVANTTNVRPDDLLSPQKFESGGLSGRPLRDRSTDAIRRLYAATGGQLVIVGVGGIESGMDAYEKFKAGASLVQVYSALVYQGPGLVSRLRRELAQELLDHGQRSIQDVIGLDHEDIHWKKQQEQVKTLQKRKSGLLLRDGDDEDES